jgi:hypothetical protein
MEEHQQTPEQASSNGSAGSGAPVLAATEARPIERAPVSQLPVPVVAATGGVIVAAATYLLLRIIRRPARGAASVRIGRGRGRRRGTLEITGSRSFLVDVHMLKR